MSKTPIYCRKAFWTSAAGTLATLAAYAAHLQHATWLAVVLAALGVICGNLGSVIAAGPDKDKTNGP
jgi:cation transporter-like permease